MAERFRMDGEEVASATRARAAFVEQNTALNELRSAKLDASAMRARSLEAKTDAEQAAAALSLERGDWADHAQRQRNISELAAQRVRAEDEYRQWQGVPVHPADPVEALIAARASEPATQNWLRSHPHDALALATGGAADPRRAARIAAADAHAVAEGHTRGTQQYIAHVDRYLGGARGSESGEGSNPRQVRVVKQGQASGDNELTKGEYRAATEDVLWGREGGSKCGSPIGVEEYLRRRNAMRGQPGWYDKLQD